MNFRHRSSMVSPASRGAAATRVEIIELLDDDGNVVMTWTKSATGAVTCNFGDATVEATLSGDEPIEISETYSNAGSHQTIAADLELDAAAGTSEVGDSDYLASIMGNVLGSALTKTKNIIAGIIGKYSIESTNASTYPKAGVIGEIGDATTTADGAFVAVLGGDSAQTNARAAFTVDHQNSTANSGFEYGVDLKGPGTHDGYNAPSYSKAVLRSVNNVVIMEGSGAPVDGTTGDNFAGPGSLYIDYTNANHYIQTGAITNPVWKLVTRAA